MKQTNNHPQCPFCKSHIVVRNGRIVRRKKEVIDENQRFLCKNCNKNFYYDATNAKVDKQRQALMMYLEGMHFSEIGKFLDVNRGTVKRWFNTYGINLDAIEPLRNLRINETKQIEEVYAIAICNDSNDYKRQSFNDGFIILERKNRVHISFLKENQKYTMLLRDKNISNKEYKRNIGRNDLQHGI